MSALSELMNIDFYGRCGKLECPRDDETCYMNLNQTYKFYLSFENSLCEVELLSYRYMYLYYSINRTT